VYAHIAHFVMLGLPELTVFTVGGGIRPYCSDTLFMGIKIPGGLLMTDIVTAVIIGAYFLLLIGIGAWGSKKIHIT